MINARDAAQLVTLSVDATNKRIEAIGEKIKDTATNGKRELFLDQVLPYNKELHLTDGTEYREPTLSELQQSVIDTLKKNGYVVKVVNVYHDDKGKGWYPAPEDDRKPYTTWHIKVSW
jgi:hypothetical protein